ncbi:hypothetical protein [Fodinibius halophilus]|uniref:DUF5683 domain-containing protein n=1 Tax=Fodinibius halophilus TaxID=1736908 RepID=A0A6M1T3B8_9BACT|nr:hypothetical protein [Fodinibius halophilus]NGP88577.1 hypothetical protein [Fodinibius halophilus]
MCRKLFVLVLLFLFLGMVRKSYSQERSAPDPKIAFLKSIAVPGWGHHHVNKSDWTRGKYHLGIDIALLLGYMGLSIHSNNLQQNWYAYGQSEAGVPIKGRSRSFQLAVGDFNSLAAYNDYQERSRNWDKLLDDTPQNRWQWDSNRQRTRYRDLRSDFEQIDQQLPALIGMMVLNRIISGISAYNRARKHTNNSSLTSVISVSPYQNSKGIVANLNIRF